MEVALVSFIFEERAIAAGALGLEPVAVEGIEAAEPVGKDFNVRN